MRIKSHKELKVYQISFDVGMKIFELSKTFPREELYSLTDQIRRCSRSVSANIAEGFRKRRYPRSFIAKLVDAEGEAAETQNWIEYAFKCIYLTKDVAEKLNEIYENIIGKLVTMENQAEKWQI